jgi:hypothetical protein
VSLDLARAGAVYCAWVVATYVLEGLPETLLRPEAAALRLAYAFVANVLIGTVLPLWLIARLMRRGLDPSAFGFGGLRRTALGVAAGFAVGFGFVTAQAGPVHYLFLVNTFAQTWVVSIAEILVCWALVASLGFEVVRLRSRAAAYAVAVFLASALFGLYHFAHSPPFNQPQMVIFLAGIGLFTSAWWFLSGDFYGTVVLHNFFAVTGVIAALKAAGAVPAQPQLAIPILVTAAGATIVVIFARVIARRRASKG